MMTLILAYFFPPLTLELIAKGAWIKKKGLGKSEILS